MNSLVITETICLQIFNIVSFVMIMLTFFFEQNKTNFIDSDIENKRLKLYHKSITFR